MRAYHRHDGRPRRHGRRGYTVMLVVIFLMLLLSALAVTHRRIATVLRLESAHADAIHKGRDKDLSRWVAARAISRIETKGVNDAAGDFDVKPDPSNPVGAKTYTLTIEAGTGANTGKWVVTATPKETGS